MSLSLLSDSVMTLSHQVSPGRLVEIPVPIPARSLLVLSGDSRHKLKHSIKPELAISKKEKYVYIADSTHFKIWLNKICRDKVTRPSFLKFGPFGNNCQQRKMPFPTEMCFHKAPLQEKKV